LAAWYLILSRSPTVKGRFTLSSRQNFRVGGASGVGAGESANAILTLVLKGKFDMCRIRI